MRAPRALVPLRRPQYRLLLTSLGLSLFSAGMWVIAVVWQVVELGGGPSQLSLVSASMAIGMLVTVLLGGVLADRVPQRTILITVELFRFVVVGSAAGLALTGIIEIWHLAIVSFIVGATEGLYYPAYSALLPSLLPAEELLAANGVEGMLRPAVMQAAGPAVAGAIVAAQSPAAAIAGTAVLAFGALLALAVMKPTALRRTFETVDNSASAFLGDVREGFVYMVRTPWLLWTLLFASIMMLLFMGPFEVLIPFHIKDDIGGGAGDHALVITAFGVGGVIGSLVIASTRLPRRYLTVMNLLWAIGCLPLAFVGVVDRIWVMCVGAFLLGAFFQGGMVIWGTLLQRRVPPALLGRVSSLDFFVSIAFMPVSMALAGPVSVLIGLDATFLIAGVGPAVLAVVAILAGRMWHDEIAHPLDLDPQDEQSRQDAPAPA